MASEDKKVLVTKEGYNELLQEQENLIHVVRQDVIRELQEARAQGDLSENADYDAARDRQARVEARIRDLESNEEETYTIVGSVESDPLQGKLSNITPLAAAIIDSKVGDVVTVNQVEEPYDVKILELIG